MLVPQSYRITKTHSQIEFMPSGLQQFARRDVVLQGVPAARGPDAVPHHDTGEDDYILC